ncbi:MAG: hypothetical protein ACOY4K_05200 [Pseudomonadota bacterium]
MERRGRTGIAPALAASLVLHVLALGAAFVFGVLLKPSRPPGGGVPVTLVASGPPELIDAPLADAAQEAQAETTQEPVPDDILDPKAEAEPEEKPASRPEPSPTAKGKTAPTRSLDFDRLLEDVQTARKGGRPKPPADRVGPAKAAATVRVGSGKRLTGAAKGYLLTLGDELGRRWRPNCFAEGASKVTVTLRFTVGPTGLVKPPPPPPDYATADAETAAYIAARRAVFAARFDEFPPELYGEELIVPFDAAVVCGSR